MSQTKTVQTNFSAGEISSNLLGRFDHERYKNGALRLENCIVTPQGTISKRNGTKAIHAWDVNSENFDLSFATDGRSNIKGTRAIPFVVDRDNAYALLFVHFDDGTDVGCKCFIYSNQDDKILEYQTGDDDARPESDGITIHVTAVPDATDSSLDVLSADDYTFSSNVADPRYVMSPTPYRKSPPGVSLYIKVPILVKVSDRTPYADPSNPEFYVTGYRDDNTGKWHLQSYDPNTGTKGTQWQSESSAGSATTFPTTGWTATVGNNTPTFSAFTFSGQVTVGDGFLFPYSATELNDVSYAQNGNSIILAHENHPPMVVTRKNKNNAVSGVDDYRKWTIERFTPEDGPYLRNSEGKELKDNDNASLTGENIPLNLELIRDFAIVNASEPTDVSGATLAINEHVEYSSMDNLLLGKIISLDLQAEGKLVVEPLGPVVTDLDPSVSIETDNAVIESVGYLMSNTTVFTKDLEGSYIRHTQKVDNTGWEDQVIWASIDKYLGQRVVKDTGTSPIIATWQAKNASGAYNDLSSFGGSGHSYSGGITMDTLELGSIVGTDGLVHFLTNGNKPTTAAASATLTSGQSLNLTYRETLYKATTVVPVFNSARDVGRKIRINLNDGKAWGTISEVVSSTEIRIKFDIPPAKYKDGESQTSTTDWQLGAWHTATGSGADDIPANFPSCVAIHDKRIWFGGGKLTPRRLDSSKLRDFLNFSPTDEDGEVLDESAISYNLDSRDGGKILWMITTESFLVGTTTGEHKVSSSENLVSLSPTNINTKEQTNFGSSSNSAINVDGNIVFIQSPGKVIRELSYNFERDSYRSINLSVVADHLFNNADPIQDVSYITHPDNYLLFRTARGRLICMTYEKENRVVAACPWSISGMSPYGISVGLAGSGSYDVTTWAASTEYLLGECVYVDGLYFQCIEQHTSGSSFLNDYSLGTYWSHTGAPVTSVCSLPAKDDRASDKFIMMTYRVSKHEDGANLALGDTLLCVETIEPVSSSLTDSYYSDSVASDSFHGDFYLNMQDSADGSFEMPIFSLAVSALLDMTDKEDDRAAENSHLSKIIQGLTSGTQEVHGLSVAVYSTKIQNIGGTPDRPSQLLASHVSQSDKLLEILDDVYAKRNLNHGSWYDSLLYRQDDTGLYTFNDVPLIPGWFIGFTFPCVITPLPIEFAGDISSGGGSLGRVRRANKVELLVEDTGEFNIVGSEQFTHNNGETQFNGIVDCDLDLGSDERQQFSIVSFSAHRLNILAITTELSINK